MADERHDHTSLGIDWLRLSSQGVADRPHPPAAPPSAPPADCIGPYEILGELGRGGMGVVYKARDTRLGRLVALKMLLSGGHSTGEQHARFRNEAEILARLTHPNIVQIHEIGEHGGLPYFAMELVEGGRLDARRERPPALAAGIVEVLARAVQHAHERGVLHRDLKPANVLLANDGALKIADFGIARVIEGDTNITRTGQVMGTPAYLAPELLSGPRRPAGPAADIYALGVILYEMLAGRTPFVEASLPDLILQATFHNPPAPGRFRPGIPADLENIALRCLEREPEGRYPSAAALADDLRNFQEGRTVSARPVGAATQAWRWARRNRLVASLLAASVLLGVALIIALAAGLYFVDARRRDAEQARAQASASEARAVQALAREEARRRTSHQALDELTHALFGDLLAGRRHLHEGQRQFLAFARRHYEAFADEGDPSASARLATIHRRLHDFTAAERRFKEAISRYAALPEGLARTRGLAAARGNLGAMLADLERPAEARAELAAAVALLARSGGGDPHACRLRALACNALGKLSGDEALHREALALQAELVRHNPDGTARAEMGRTHALLGAARQARGDTRAARAHFESALALWAGADRPEIREQVAGVRGQLGIVLQRLGRRGEAMREATAAAAEAGQLARTHVSVPDYWLRAAVCEADLGGVLKEQGRGAEALEALARSAAALERCGPPNANWRQAALLAHWGRAELLFAGRSYDDALLAVGMALQATRAAERPRLLVLRLGCRAGAGRHEEALREVGNLQLDHLPADVYYDLAGGCAIVGARQATPREWAEPYAAAAVRLLEKARDGGFFATPGRAARLAGDQAFAALRGREDWRRLVASLPRAGG